MNQTRSAAREPNDGVASEALRWGTITASSLNRPSRRADDPRACATPARVFKGMKMAGRMGGEKQTVLNLEVVQVDPERALLMVKGAVPGTKGSVVVVRGAVKTRG